LHIGFLLCYNFLNGFDKLIYLITAELFLTKIKIKTLTSGRIFYQASI